KRIVQRYIIIMPVIAEFQRGIFFYFLFEAFFQDPSSELQQLQHQKQQVALKRFMLSYPPKGQRLWNFKSRTVME
ncbi:MAG: hypothetical protein K6T85_19800, partial [Gorillibacterium sp.]|nr:hypothetical protein [Gorillibacterium sp.]